MDAKTLIDDLRKLGIKEDDTILVHSSYNALKGHDVIEGGPQAVIDALKATVAAIGENEPTEAQVEELKAGKEKLMNSAQQLFSKMYEQAQAAGAQGAGPDMGAGSKPEDDVVDGDFTEV